GSDNQSLRRAELAALDLKEGSKNRFLVFIFYVEVVSIANDSHNLRLIFVASIIGFEHGADYNFLSNWVLSSKVMLCQGFIHDHSARRSFIVRIAEITSRN